jgi:nicotinate-nucleotide--dimethylbenzimidazole phosphoribosyltransferase
MHFSISPPATMPGLQARIDGKTKPPGSLGQLERLALQIGQVQQSLTPESRSSASAGLRRRPRRRPCRCLGLPAGSDLADGRELSRRRRGDQCFRPPQRPAVAGDRRWRGARFRRRDGLVDAKIAFGTRNSIEQAAMSAAERDLALARGAAIARGLADQGCRVMAFGEMGIGNTAAASLLTQQLTGTPLADCVGRGTGLDTAGLARKRTCWRRRAAARRYRPMPMRYWCSPSSAVSRWR